MKSGKTIETAQRALEILKILMHQNLSVDEILDLFSDNEDYSSVYTKEAIYKYFNTFKLAGIELQKNKTKYNVNKMFLPKTLSPDNILIFNLLEQYIQATQQTELLNKFQEIKEILIKNNLLSNTNIEILNYEKIFKINKKYEKHKQLIQKLEEISKNKQTVKIIYQSSDNNLLEYKAVINQIFFEKGSLLVKTYNIDTFSIINLPVEEIQDIQQLPQRAGISFFTNTVIFKVMDELANNYQLKNGEYVKEKGENYLIIANNQQGSNDLIKRLLRYQDKCKIIYPKQLQEEMHNKIQSMLNIYEK